MNTLTINKPIIIRQFIGMDDIYTYINYSIGYKYITDFTTLDVGFKNIYYGKAFVNSDGYIEVDVTDVIKNYAFRHEYIYDIDRQKWVPENIKRNNMHQLEPIETSTHYRTTVFAITDNTNHEWEIYVGVTSMFFPEYYSDEKVQNPYDSNGFRDVISINYSGILPHIPLIYTNNYFVSLESVIPSSLAGEWNSRYIDCDSIGRGELRYHGYGNYSTSYTLTDFWDLFDIPVLHIIDAGDVVALDDYIDAGGAGSHFPYIPAFGASTIIEPQDDTVRNSRRDFIYVDACPKKYYISWTTPFGEWQSQPLQSVAFVEQTDNLNIHTTKRVLHNIENRSQAQFKCKSMVINNAEYKLFSTLLMAPYIILYDVEKDKSYYCVFNSSTLTTYDKSKNQKVIEFQLKQINKTIN